MLQLGIQNFTKPEHWTPDNPDEVHRDGSDSQDLFRQPLAMSIPFLGNCPKSTPRVTVCTETLKRDLVSVFSVMEWSITARTLTFKVFG
jgi:hypothetical protein